jgi:hypothetical protein
MKRSFNISLKVTQFLKIIFVTTFFDHHSVLSPITQFWCYNNILDNVVGP